MAKKTDEKIRVHNKGKRDFTFPPSKIGGKNRLVPAGRAVEIEEDLALKMIKAYPGDLIEFDSLVSGEKKNLSREVSRLEVENKILTEKVEKLESDIKDLLEEPAPKAEKKEAETSSKKE